MYPKSVLANKNRKRTVRRRDFYSPESKMFGSGNQRKSYQKFDPPLLGTVESDPRWTVNNGPRETVHNGSRWTVHKL